jgi:phosphatidylinositol dimannoside acyltransferase
VALSQAMRGRRTMISRHLRRAHGGDLAGADLEREVRRAFDSYARYWLESFRLPAVPAAEVEAGMSSYEGLELIEEARHAGHGAILAMPHLGGWDFGGAWLARRGHPITVVVEPLEPPQLLDWFAEFRESIGLTVVPLGPDVGAVVLRALKGNEVVALLCDRDITGSGVDVEFFGERTTLPAGPATLALRTGAPLLPTAVYFDGDRGHHGVVRPAVPAERRGRLRDDVARTTQALAHELEVLIRRDPAQWHLLQPNWPSDPGYGAPSTR